MVFKILLSIDFLGAVIAFHQNDCEIKHHRLEVISHNPRYCGNIKASLIPFNRTARAINASFELLRDYEAPFMLVLEAFKFASNEYRPFPFHLPIDYCNDMLKKDTFGLSEIKNHSNLTPCPLKKGHYYINKYRPDESKFPPHLITGDFKLSIEFVYKSITFAKVDWYGSLKKIEKLWN